MLGPLEIPLTLDRFFALLPRPSSNQDEQFYGRKHYPCDCAGPLYPNNVCRWNPGYQGLSNELFPAFYQNVVGSLGESAPTRVPICVSLNHTLPSILNFVPSPSSEGAAAEYKPIFPAGPATDPSSYEYYADYLTQFSRHFGGPPSVTIPSKQPSQPIAPNAIVGYIEPWNEPDKNYTWYNDPGPNLSQVGFTKEEYAALAKAVYNGNGGAMNGDMPDGVTHYPLGVSNFPQVRMVMAGISEFDAPNLEYIDNILAAVMAGGLPKATWDICNAAVKPREQEVENKITAPMVRVYPNPAQTTLYIESSLYAVNYKVYSMIGTEIRQGYLDGHLAIIDISLLSNGLYLLVIDGLLRPVKFVVSH